MAERRITRRYHTMQPNNKRETGTIPEEESEKASIVSKSKDATVEVTVKVKKRRDKSVDSSAKFIPLPDKEFRKGSWGDLLLANSRTSLACRDGEAGKTKKVSRKSSTSRDTKQIRGEGKDGHSPLCQKIPLTDDLYLETHTHVRKSVRSMDGDGDAKADINSKISSMRQAVLVKENEDLHYEIERLRREVEVTKIRNRATRSLSKPANKDWMLESSKLKRKPETQATQTSTTCLVSPKKKSSVQQTETDGGPKSPPKKLVPTTSNSEYVQQYTTQLENLRLEKENEALRREAAQLLTEMNKARSEYLECCNTMRELYQIAENLKRDNHNLIQNHEQQQTLQSKLLQALAENREMKDVVDSLVEKQKPSHGLQDDQLHQIRNVIKNVKRTIEQEMHGLALQPSASAFLAEKDNNDSDAMFRIGDSLNDTNASEIQNILGIQPAEIRRGYAQEDRSSSTQYLTLGGLPGFDRSSHYRPSPLAMSKYSPRISTPNSSNASLNLSEACGVQTSFYPIQPATTTKEINSNDDSWRKLEQEVSSSFVPLRKELSMCSTSSYSGSSSTSSSPNPRT